MSENNEGASKRKNLGMVFLNTNKDKPTSFDIKGSCVFNGQKIRLGGYKKKLPVKAKWLKALCSMHGIALNHLLMEILRQLQKLLHLILQN